MGSRARRDAAAAAFRKPQIPVREAPGRRAAAPSEVAGQRISHPDRLVFRDAGLTKLDLARYFERVAVRMLPQVRGRPLTLVRCPEGVDSGCFYMKHSGVWAPASLRRVRIREKTKVGQYLVADDVAALAGLAQMGIVEIHTWNSRADAVESPDRIVLDLDPGPRVAWSAVVEAARLLRGRLRALGFESFVKTTGGKGLHVVVPLVADSNWEATFIFSRWLASDLARADPRRYTVAMPKAGRETKILIDYLRNNRGNTSVAAYSTRAKPGAPVSMPLAWDELGGRVHASTFTVADVAARLADADPWARYEHVQARQSLQRLIQRGGALRTAIASARAGGP